MGFAEGDEDAVGCSNKSPKEKDHYECSECTGIGGLFRLVHGKRLVLGTGCKIMRF
jgi:hypothetical protein